MTPININDLNNAKLDVNHIAEIATSTGLTATDRLGNVKPTVLAAVNTLAAFNSRGAFVAGQAYAIKDVYTSGGIAYVVHVAHTSAAVPETDLAAGRVGIHQGATREDLAASGGAALIGNGGETVAQSIKGALNAIKAMVPSEIIPHRGFAASALQNTLLAFSTAITRGATSIEFDLQISSDGVIYAFHDTNVDALTSGTGPFTSLSSAAVDALTFDAAVGTIFADERVPRLTDVLALARNAGVKIYPEIKGVWPASKQQELIALLQQYGFDSNRCCIQSGYIVYVEDLRKLSANVELLYVGTGNLAVSKTFIDRVAAVGKGSMGWSMAELLAEPAFVTYCYGKEVDVIAFTIISTENVRQLRAIGVRRFFSDIFIESAV